MFPPVDHAIRYLRRHQALYGDQLILENVELKCLRNHCRLDSHVYQRMRMRFPWVCEVLPSLALK